MVKNTGPRPTVTVRDARQADARPIAELIKQAKADAMPWLPVVHSLEEDVAWVSAVLLPEHRVRVAAVRSDHIVGVVAARPGWIDQLYVATPHRRSGLGSLLLADALDEQRGAVRLWVFARNAAARHFYESRGFHAVRTTDGHDNEEQEPDVLYVSTEPGMKKDELETREERGARTRSSTDDARDRHAD